MSVWCSTSASFNLALLAGSSQSVFQWLCLFWWFFQCFLSTCYPFALFFSVFCVMDSVSVFPHPAVWGIVVVEPVCHCSRSDRQREHGVWNCCVGYLHLITCLPPCIRHIQVWESYSLQHIMNISHKARIWVQLHLLCSSQQYYNKPNKKSR